MATQIKASYRTLRLTRVPKDLTAADLRNQLRAIGDPGTPLGQTLKTVVVKSLVPRSSDFCTATLVCEVQSDLSTIIQEFHDHCEENEIGYRLDNDFTGLTPLANDGDKTICDIIAVPGLNSHALGSWKTPGRTDVWIQDWLPQTVDGIRVLTYGYDSSLQNSRSFSSIEILGQSLLDALTAYRRNTDTSTRPVIFLGHSLGGLLVKEALVRSAQSSRAENQQLHQACCGMIFFGVPHFGARLDSLQTIVGDQPNAELVSSIVVNKETQASQYLNRLSTDFARYFSGEARIVLIYETRQSNTLIEVNGRLEKSGEAKLLVTQFSATRIGTTGMKDEDIIPFEADHFELNKFQSDQDHSYETIRDRISDLVGVAASRSALVASQTFDSRQTPEHDRRGLVVTQSGPTFSGNNTITNGGVISQGNGNTNNLSWRTVSGANSLHRPTFATNVSGEDIETDRSHFRLGNNYATGPYDHSDPTYNSSTSATNIRATNNSNVHIGNSHGFGTRHKLHSRCRGFADIDSSGGKMRFRKPDL